MVPENPTGLSPEELERYSRHLRIPGFGPESQEKLKNAKVLVVGAGGLGSPMLMYLAAAGIGTIGIVEFDSIDLSNLQRQVLYSTNDLGKSKAESAAQRIKEINPNVRINLYQERVSAENALKILADYDLVADGTDNFPTRYLVNDACVLLGIPNVYASIFRFEGQVSVFNLMKDGLRGPNYRDIFPEPPAPEFAPSCAEGGVLGVLPGIIGSMQASEVIKVITGLGEPLTGRLFILDALSFSTQTLKFGPDPGNPISGDRPTIYELIDYEAFCNGKSSLNQEDEISAKELKVFLSDENIVLIDVREPFEYEASSIPDSLNIPQSKIESNIDTISKTEKVILYCRSGKRSATALALLKRNYSFQNIQHLKGGIISWKAEFDPEMVVL